MSALLLITRVTLFGATYALVIRQMFRMALGDMQVCRGMWECRPRATIRCDIMSKNASIKY